MMFFCHVEKRVSKWIDPAEEIDLERGEGDKMTKQG